MTPRILVRYIVDCPGLDLLRQRLVAISNDQPGLEVVFELVTAEEEALRLGFCGSPTVLINGRDPFAVEGATPGLSCRLYATEQGIEPAPSLGQLRHALTQNRPTINQMETRATGTEVAGIRLHLQIATGDAEQHDPTARRHREGDKRWSPPSTAPN